MALPPILQEEVFPQRQSWLEPHVPRGPHWKLVFGSSNINILPPTWLMYKPWTTWLFFPAEQFSVWVTYFCLFILDFLPRDHENSSNNVLRMLSALSKQWTIENLLKRLTPLLSVHGPGTPFDGRARTWAKVTHWCITHKGIRQEMKLLVSQQGRQSVQVWKAQCASAGESWKICHGSGHNL